MKKNMTIYVVAAMVSTAEESYPYGKAFASKEEALNWIMKDREETQNEWGEPCTMKLPEDHTENSGDYILTGNKSGWSIVYHIYKDTFIFDEKKSKKVAKAE